MKKEKQKGFTLIEVLLVIAIMSIIVTVSLSSWQSFSDSTNLGDTAKMIETKIKLAKSYSLSALNDANYGIRFEADRITLFDAVTSTDIVPSYDLTDGVEIYEIGLSGAGGGGTCNNNSIKDNGEIGVDCGGGGCLACSTEVIFSRLTGVGNSGTVGIRVKRDTSKTKTITINSQGQTGTDTFGVSTISPINNARHVHYNLNWNIKNATVLTLAWTDSLGNPLATNSVTPIASYFNATQSMFDWTGTTLVKVGVSQKIRIHSWVDGLDNTILCVMRDQTETDTLKISFNAAVIATYTNNSGTITVTPGLTVNSMALQ